VLRAEFARHGGLEVKEAGDAFLVAFSSVQSALACAVASQQALFAQPWPEAVNSLAVRMALHTGDVTVENGEYHGLALHRASRILTAAHGGQILLSEAMAALVQRDLSEGVRLLDLGVFRLRDMPASERLFQVEYPGMAQRQFPPLAAEQGHKTNLPVQFTRFFGRQEELARLSHMLLLPQQTRLVTITGTGGTGKTRLALEVAARLTSSLEGAVWFVELEDLRDTSLIADTVMGALHAARSPDKAPADVVAEALSAYASPLLILDNFEHLVEEGALFVQTLLARVPSLRCLVTSRQVLGLAGEREFALGPLPTPNGMHSLESLSLFESVQLFVERAQAVRPDFQITTATAPAVAQLCDALEGIPLAIELAAARAQVMTPSQMLSQIGHRFDFLVGRRRGASERQRTLRATLDWSYRLLSPDLQRFFSSLSVFRGGWTAEAAEAVCKEPLALDYLAQLRECSLVMTKEDAAEIRFRMLETLREYGRERLTELGEKEETQRRHVHYHLALADEYGATYNSPEFAARLHRLETEHDNLRAALTWCKDKATPDSVETGLRLAAALRMFWDLRGYWSEGRMHLTQMLSLEVGGGVNHPADECS
jgi:predicted ATPase